MSTKLIGCEPGSGRRGDEAEHVHLPGKQAAYALDTQAADRTRRPKPTVAGSLTELRVGWRASAIRAFGVDVVLAVIDTVAVVYVMRGVFTRLHLLAEARRCLAYALRGRPHQAGLDDQIVRWSSTTTPALSGAAG